MSMILGETERDNRLKICTVKSQVLAHLVLKHMQTFSDCLSRGFLMLLAKSLFLN